MLAICPKRHLKNKYDSIIKLKYPSKFNTHLTDHENFFFVHQQTNIRRSCQNQTLSTNRKLCDGKIRERKKEMRFTNLVSPWLFNSPFVPIDTNLCGNLSFFRCKSKKKSLVDVMFSLSWEQSERGRVPNPPSLLSHLDWSLIPTNEEMRKRLLSLFPRPKWYFNQWTSVASVFWNKFSSFSQLLNTVFCWIAQKRKKKKRGIYFTERH